MNYLSGEDILVIHSEIIDSTGGAHGVRDVNLFLSVVDKPKASFGGQEVYGDVFAKAAAYLEALAKYHVFTDGNKRTALAAAARFLFINGYELVATNKEAENFMLQVVMENLNQAEIMLWLRRNSQQKIRRYPRYEESFE